MRVLQFMLYSYREIPGEEIAVRFQA